MESFQHEQDRIAAETQALTARAEPELDLEVAPKVVELAFAIIDDIAPAYLRANDRERGMWNEAVFAGIWIGDRAITRVACQDLFASALSDTSSNWVSLVAVSDTNRTIELAWLPGTSLSPRTMRVPPTGRAGPIWLRW
jgi:hypothetical protein